MKRRNFLKALLVGGGSFIVGTGFYFASSDTQGYWNLLNGYYSKHSDIELQPLLVEIHKLVRDKEVYEMGDLHTFEYLVKQLDSLLEDIKAKYQLRMQQLSQMNLTGREKMDFSYEETQKRAEKNYETISTTVPSLVNIYTNEFAKKYKEQFPQAKFALEIFNNPIDISTNPLKVKSGLAIHSEDIK